MMPLLRLAAARSLHACEACFGAAGNQDLAKAYTWGFVVLITFTFLILGGLTWAVVRMEAEKSRRDAAGHDSA